MLCVYISKSSVMLTIMGTEDIVCSFPCSNYYRLLTRSLQMSSKCCRLDALTSAASGRQFNTKSDSMVAIHKCDYIYIMHSRVNSDMPKIQFKGTFTWKNIPKTTKQPNTVKADWLFTFCGRSQYSVGEYVWICMKCNLSVIRDQFYFLFECPAYNDYCALS